MARARMTRNVVWKIKVGRGRSYLGSYDKKTAKQVIKGMKKANPRGKYMLVRRRMFA